MKRFRSTGAVVAACLLASACGESPTDTATAVAMEPNRILPGAATAGSTLAPAVRLTDANGQPVAGAAVTFEITAGGGSVSSPTATTNGSGIATLSAWTLGPGLVTNTLVVRHESLPPVTFTVMGCSTYCIDIRFVGTVSAAQRAAFMNARQRWEQVITADLAPVQFSVPADVCEGVDGEVLVSTPALNELIDDLVVYVQLDSIDGPGQVVGSAGPCFIRNSSRLPLFGIMLLDRSDLNLMEQNGLLSSVVLHELGHVLGFPTIWEDPQFALLQDTATSNPYFTGSNAASAFQLAGGTLVNGVGVPVENVGGAGTRNSHWRESVMSTELMTGTISTGTNPLSAITIGSLDDIGYTVNYAAADAYTLPGAGAQAGPGTAPRVELVERPVPAPRMVH